MEPGNILLIIMTLLLCGIQCTNVNKRSDDTNPLESVVAQLTADLNKLQAQVTAQDEQHAQLLGEIATLKTGLAKQEQHAAFLAQISSDHNSTTAASGPIVYNNVVFNDGHGYDPSLGVFTAPYAGVYVFTTQFYTHGTQPSRPVLDMMVNGNQIIRMAFDSESTNSGAGYEQDSHATSITVRLRAGDRVWVAAGYHQEFWVYGAHHTYFSGALLYST